jgi:CRP/FNR family cyclic AMP-dependent transcriptional regulator
VLAYLSAGPFFGELCLFPEQKARTAIVRTRTPALVVEIGYQNFYLFNQKHPEIMFKVAGQLAERVRDTSRRLSDLAFLDVSGRIARALLDLCKRPEAVQNANGTSVRISRQELARNVGCSCEMAGRVLKRLEEECIVSSKGRSILVYGAKAIMA